MYHSWFIHSLTEGHLGCFQVLEIKNKAVINIHVYVGFYVDISFQLMVKYQGASLGYMVRECLVL